MEIIMMENGFELEIPKLEERNDFNESLDYLKLTLPDTIKMMETVPYIQNDLLNGTEEN